MKKRFLLITILAVIFLGGIFWAFHTAAESSQVKVDELSDRAKEFIEEESKKSGSSWKRSDVTNPDSPQTSNQPKTFTTQCMVIQFPVISRNEHVTDEEKNCVVELRMDSPPARVVIAAEPSDQSLDENSGVILRKKFTNDYQEKEVSYPKWKQTMRFDQKDGTVVFLKNSDWVITIGVTEMIQPEKLGDELVDQIVAGVVLHE